VVDGSGVRHDLTVTKTGITVSGTGRAAGTPDIAVLRLAAESTGVSVAEAVRGASDSLAAMRAALQGHDIRAADLQTSEVSVHPNHGRSGPRGYIARFGLAAIVRDAEAAGACAQAAIDAGEDAARLDGLEYQHSNLAQLRTAARDAAFADAAARAEQLAGLADRALGPVDEITEHGATGPGPIPMRAVAAEMDMAFAPGEQEISVMLTIRWSWS